MLYGILGCLGNMCHVAVFLVRNVSLYVSLSVIRSFQLHSSAYLTMRPSDLLIPFFLPAAYAQLDIFTKATVSLAPNIHCVRC